MFDFHTASEESLLGKLKSIRISTKSRVAQAANNELWSLSLSLSDGCPTNYNDTIHSSRMARVNYYTLSVPWYLTNLNREGNHVNPSLLNLSSSAEISNIPLAGQVGLLIQVPCSIVNGYIFPSRLIGILIFLLFYLSLYLSLYLLIIIIYSEYGHGIFASRSDARNTWMTTEANKIPETNFMDRRPPLRMNRECTDQGGAPGIWRPRQESNLRHLA